MIFDFDVHVCLISEQQAPNLLPALDPELRPKARKMVMLVSDKMKPNADRLVGVLKRHGFHPNSLTMLDINPYDYEGICNKLAGHLDRPENKGKKIALNITGGTKIMALAAQAVFFAAGLPMFYVNESTSRVIVMDGKTSPGEGFPLGVKLHMKDYLSAYGYKPKLPSNLRFTPKFAKELVDSPSRYEKGLIRLNGIVVKAKSKTRLDFAGETNDDAEVLKPILALCAEHRLVKSPVLKPGSWSFVSLSARKYVCGGWLEDYVFDALSGLEDKIQGKERDLEIRTVPKDVENQLDVVFIADNRLHIIECKTGRLEQAAGFTDEHNKATPALDKLRNLMSRTGLKTKALLVTWRELDQKNNPLNKNRAEAYGIKVIQKDELRDLKTQLAKWIEARD